MSDIFCRPLHLNANETIYGGAARNKRIAQAGGLERLLNKVISSAFEEMSNINEEPTHRSNVVPINRKSA
jgi:hypothetical protein